MSDAVDHNRLPPLCPSQPQWAFGVDCQELFDANSSRVLYYHPLEKLLVLSSVNVVHGRILSNGHHVQVRLEYVLQISKQESMGIQELCTEPEAYFVLREFRNMHGWTQDEVAPGARARIYRIAVSDDILEQYGLTAYSRQGTAESVIIHP